MGVRAVIMRVLGFVAFVPAVFFVLALTVLLAVFRGGKEM